MNAADRLAGRARDDLSEIIRHVAAEDPPAARRLKRLIEEAVLPTAQHPYLYHKSERIPGMREIVAHPNYIALCRVAAFIEVVAVVHARREFPAA